MTTPPRSPDAVPAADVRRCDPHAEIARSVRLLAWLERVPIAELLRASPPQPGDDLVSVVVPAYNASAWIDACLKGLLAQSHTNLEIFCVDDASDDGTYERVVERFGEDARICAIKLGRSVGPYQIKNWVIGALARGRWVALQDADDVSHPLRLAMQLEWMTANGYRASGTCVHQFFPPDLAAPIGEGPPLEIDGERHNLAFFPSVERTLDPEGPIRERRTRAGESFWELCRSGPYKVYGRVFADHGTQMMERSLFLEMGGFDGRTKMAADSEFNLRLLRFHSLGNVPAVLYSRRFHENSLTQHPATGLRSAARADYRASRSVRESELRAALAAGDLTRARELCTADLHCADVELVTTSRRFMAPPQTRGEGDA